MSGLVLVGKDRFLDGQLDVVLAALRGESMLVVRPTGSGKTLCFQLPAILSQGTTYVLSPLKALMSEQVVALQKLKIPATFINSDLTQVEKSLRYSLLEKHSFKLLYLTPERLDKDVILDQGEIEILKRVHPSYLVLDEAHCVDRWGDDFRRSYGRIQEVRSDLGNPPILAFTATAGKEAQKRILNDIGAPSAKVFVSDINRPNIALVRHSPSSEVERLLITKKLISTSNGKVMIFVPTKKVGEELSQSLNKIGLHVPFYHSQLNAIDKEFLLGQFTGRLEPELNAIVCTNAFGMGLDIPNVRVVIHWVQPESVEDYLQEFGRAGRDGKPSMALIFKISRDTGIRKFMAEKTLEAAQRQGIDGTASFQRKIHSIDELDRMIRNSKKCFRKQLVGYFQDGGNRNISLTMRILEWIFGRKIKVQKAEFCCDYCDAKRSRKLTNTN